MCLYQLISPSMAIVIDTRVKTQYVQCFENDFEQSLLDDFLEKKDTVNTN